MGRVKYRVTPTDDGNWRVKSDGAQRADSIHENKSDAKERATDLAKDQPLGQVIIHGQDGKIQTEHTYGKDPKRCKG